MPGGLSLFRSTMPRVLRALLAFALAAAMVLAAGRLRAARDAPYDVEVVPPAAAARWLSLGHALLASHLYWLRTVQYIGEPRADARGWDHLFPLVELVTDLDPRHGYAYQVTGIVLASANRLDESNAILEKGTRNVPDRYVLPYYRAFNAFYYGGDWATAGRWAQLAAEAPGAPAHVREAVLAFYAKGDQVEAALEFLRRERAEAQDEESRKALDAQIEQALVERVARRIDAAIERWRERHGGVAPVALESLVYEGLLDEIPADPTGGVFYVGPDGQAHSTTHPRRISRSKGLEESPELPRHAPPSRP